MNVTVRNIITSMRLMSAFNWKEFFESISLVDEILREETKFAEMDFSTRDSYRHAIEDLSKGSIHSEIEVAQRVLRLNWHARSQPLSGSPLAEERAPIPATTLSREGVLPSNASLDFVLRGDGDYFAGTCVPRFPDIWGPLPFSRL